VASARFASSGLRTSLKDIADACGILPGSLYHHFASKDALIVELVERYLADLDAVALEARDRLRSGEVDPVPGAIEAVGAELAACALRHRAALLLTVYDPPDGAAEALVRARSHAPPSVLAAVVETLRAGREAGTVRVGLDLDAVADRFCQALLHVGLGVLPDADSAAAVARLRSRILLDGIAVDPPDDATLDRSAPLAAAVETVDAWDKADEAEDDRLPHLRAVARAEFGRRGYEATTVRDIAAAAGLSTGSVYRLVGSKDELLASIMGSFAAKARTAWRRVLGAEGSTVEKLDALMWVNICAVDRFSDEYNIQLAWLRESPPSSANLGSSFTARLRDLKALVAQGIRAGELEVDGRPADLRAWALFEMLWLPESIVHGLGPAPAHALVRDTVLRGAAAGAGRRR